MAKKDRHILAREQRLGAIVLLVIALAVWLFLAFYHAEKPATPPDKPTKKSWTERQDSIRLADSLRFAQWQEKREARYDSVKQALAVRHEAYKAELQQWYDSTHIADSLWRDSIGIRFVKKIKKDTILDLNHCDTAELQLIRGIGRYTAVQIVKYRKQLGGFYSPEQLTDEPFAKLSLDSSDVQLLRINSFSVEALARHPYLRYEQAKAIYTLRRKRVRLNTINDLRALPELPDSTLSRLAPYLSFE